MVVIALARTSSLGVSWQPNFACSRRVTVRSPGAEAPRFSQPARRHGGCGSLLQIASSVAAAAVPLRLRHLVAARG